MNAEKLQRIGLNRNEGQLYLALLELTEAQAGKLSKKTQINRTTVYDVLERLLEKGLVTYVIQSNRKVFRPVPPEKLIENIKEKERAAQELLPELKRIHKTSKEAESNIHKGRKGIKTILQDILKCKNYVAFGSKGNFLEIMKHDFEAFQKRKKELKIEAKVILGSSARKTESTRLAYTKFRFIPEGFAAPTTTFVYGNKIAVIIWSEIPVATVIKSKDVAKSYKSHFEILWDVAKK